MTCWRSQRWQVVEPRPTQFCLTLWAKCFSYQRASLHSTTLSPFHFLSFFPPQSPKRWMSGGLGRILKKEGLSQFSFIPLPKFCDFQFPHTWLGHQDPRKHRLPTGSWYIFFCPISPGFQWLHFSNSKSGHIAGNTGFYLREREDNISKIKT